MKKLKLIVTEEDGLWKVKRASTGRTVYEGPSKFIAINKAIVRAYREGETEVHVYSSPWCKIYKAEDIE